MTNRDEEESTVSEEIEQESTMTDQVGEIPLDEPLLETPTEQTIPRQRRRKEPAHTKSEILPERSVRSRKPPLRYSHTFTPARTGKTPKLPKVEYKAEVTFKRNRNSAAYSDTEMILPESSILMYSQDEEVTYEYEEPAIAPIQILNSYSLAQVNNGAAGPSTQEYLGNGDSTPQQADSLRTVPSFGRDKFICKTVSGLVLEGVEFPRNKWS